MSTRLSCRRISQQLQSSWDKEMNNKQTIREEKWFWVCDAISLRNITVRSTVIEACGFDICVDYSNESENLRCEKRRNALIGRRFDAIFIKPQLAKCRDFGRQQTLTRLASISRWKLSKKLLIMCFDSAIHRTTCEPFYLLRTSAESFNFVTSWWNFPKSSHLIVRFQIPSQMEFQKRGFY